MAHLTSCSCCQKSGTDELCTECADIIAKDSMSGIAYDRGSVLRQIQARREAERDEALRSLSERCPECGNLRDMTKF